MNDRGVIGVGKPADIVLVRGDPSRDISAFTHIEQAWRHDAKGADKLGDFKP